MSSSMVLVVLQKVSHRHGRIPNARRNDVELVFATFGCNFSLAFQRAKERRNPSSYTNVMAVGANATQNSVFGPRTLLELTCTSSCDWTLQGHWFRTTVRCVGCMHGSDCLFNDSRRSRKFHTGTEGFQMHVVFATFGCNFSLAFQRAKERRNPSSYAKVMAVGANATQNGVFGPRTLLELTCTISCD